MNTFTSFILCLLSLLLLTSTNCTHESTETLVCPTQVCSYDDPVIRHVRFPFRILNDSLPRICGYPSFDLFCDGDAKLLIELPNSGNLVVQSIDYLKQELQVNDPRNCLPKRLLSLSKGLNYFDASPFELVDQEQVYFLYNCSNDYLRNFGDIKLIECLSDPNYGTFASTNDTIVSNNTTSECSSLGSIKIPKGPNSSEAISSDLSEDIRLTWADPSCFECYKRLGRCGFKSNASLELGCFDVPHHHHDLSRQAAITIALALSAPLAVASIYIAFRTLREIYIRRQRRTQIGFTEQELQSEAHGLDPTVIESYPKVVLGESCRLPKPDDKSCPICLGEYLPKETLRTIPECGHCFHADCVDEWLRLNASCPVCRMSPNTSENDAQVYQVVTV